MNAKLILKALDLVLKFNKKFYCPKELFIMSANIEIGASNLKLSIHRDRDGWVYYENSGDFYEKSNEENLNNFVELLTKLMEESK